MIDFAGDSASLVVRRSLRRRVVIKLIEATRRPNYLAGLAVVILATIVTALVVYEPAPAVKRAGIPEPHTISQLRAIDKVSQFPPCNLPFVEPKPDWRTFSGPDGIFTIAMPRPWMRMSMDTTSSLFHDPEAEFTDRRDNYLDVDRIAHGATGRSYIQDRGGIVKPDFECEVASGNAGVIWSFYTRPVDENDIRYRGLADGVTPTGQRYHLAVVAWTKTRRDSVAAIVTQAILNQ